MSKHYKHLSKEERDCLAILKGQGHSIRAIVAQLGRSPSTISRELRRNNDHSTSDRDMPHQAQAEADLRWKINAIELNTTYPAKAYNNIFQII